MLLLYAPIDVDEIEELLQLVFWGLRTFLSGDSRTLVAILATPAKSRSLWAPAQRRTYAEHIYKLIMYTIQIGCNYNYPTTLNTNGLPGIGCEFNVTVMEYRLLSKKNKYYPFPQQYALRSMIWGAIPSPPAFVNLHKGWLLDLSLIKLGDLPQITWDFGRDLYPPPPSFIK